MKVFKSVVLTVFILTSVAGLSGCSSAEPTAPEISTEPQKEDEEKKAKEAADAEAARLAQEAADAEVARLAKEAADAEAAKQKAKVDSVLVELNNFQGMSDDEKLAFNIVKADKAKKRDQILEARRVVRKEKAEKEAQAKVAAEAARFAQMVADAKVIILKGTKSFESGHVFWQLQDQIVKGMVADFYPLTSSKTLFTGITQWVDKTDAEKVSFFSVLDHVYPHNNFNTTTVESYVLVVELERSPDLPLVRSVKLYSLGVFDENKDFAVEQFKAEYAAGSTQMLIEFEVDTSPSVETIDQRRNAVKKDPPKVDAGYFSIVKRPAQLLYAFGKGALNLATGLLSSFSTAPAVDANNAPGVDANNAPAVDANNAPAVDANNAPGVDANNAPGVDANNAPGVDANNAAVPAGDFAVPANSNQPLLKPHQLIDMEFGGVFGGGIQDHN